MGAVGKCEEGEVGPFRDVAGGCKADPVFYFGAAGEETRYQLKLLRGDSITSGELQGSGVGDERASVRANRAWWKSIIEMIG